MSLFTLSTKLIVNRLLEPLGLYMARTSPSSDVRQVVEALKPIDCGHELIRVGGENDGGYLLPDDLAGIGYCFSPGVGDSSSFELDLLGRGICSFLADRSVDAPPVDLADCTFSKTFIGAVNDDQCVSLDRWVAESLKAEDDRDLILQMDIEGAEYESLLSAMGETLMRFRIMAVEFHNMESLRDISFCSIALSTIRRIREHFEVVHLHPNNANGIRSVCGVTMPQTLEVTFLRKDRVKWRRPVAQLPHPLDQPNMVGRRDIALPEDWL